MPWWGLSAWPCPLWTSGSLAHALMGPLSLAMSAVDLWLPSSCPEIKGPLSSAMSAVDLWLPGSCPEIKGPLSLATLIPRLSRRSRAVRFQRWLYLPEQCWRLCDQPRRLFLGPHPCLCNNPRLPGTGWPVMHTEVAAVRKRHAGYLRMQRVLAAGALGARLPAPVPDLVAEFFF